MANGDGKFGVKREGTKGPVFPPVKYVDRVNPNSLTFESSGSHLGTVSSLDAKDDLLLVIGVNDLEMLLVN